MKNPTLKQIKAVQTTEDLQALNLGRVIVDISHRGGGVGINGSQLAEALEISDHLLPRNYGAGCNYLGGGVRGKIFPSGYSKEITGKTAKILDELGKAAVRVYQNIEDENEMNNEDSEDGDINWDAKATNAVRKAGGPGAISGY